MNKPQCTTAAQCLKELARVMEQFGIIDQDRFIDSLKMINSKYVKYLDARPNFDRFPDFSFPRDWQFAIAEVEGKPVFIGDELYDMREHLPEGNRKFTVCELHGRSIERFSTWNPPKPKTGTVELPMRVIEQYASCNGSYAPYREEIQQACKLTLAKLNETNTRTD